LELFGFSKPKKKARVDDGNGDQPEAGDRQSLLSKRRSQLPRLRRM
jgi:hypothetical protein